MKIQGVSDVVLIASSFDFLGLSQNDSIKLVAKEALEFYGCGSCGPRGFYGTVDKHIEFERAIAKFLGAEVHNVAVKCIIAYRLLSAIQTELLQ